MFSELSVNGKDAYALTPCLIPPVEYFIEQDHQSSAAMTLDCECVYAPPPLRFGMDNCRYRIEKRHAQESTWAFLEPISRRDLLLARISRQGCLSVLLYRVYGRNGV